MQFDETKPFNLLVYFMSVFITFTMNFVYFKTILLMNGWLIAEASPVAMLQHATSSQSIVFHQLQAAPTTPSESIASPVVSSGSSNSKYEYKYEVSDHQTGDRKSHWEKRDGNNVRGVYTLYEPDGALRTVEYTADALHGFNAVVKRNEPNKHQQRHSSAYIHDMPSSSNRVGYDQSNIAYGSDGITFSDQAKCPKNLRKTDSDNHGVDFSIVHEHRPV